MTVVLDMAAASTYNPQASWTNADAGEQQGRDARVAQLVEHTTENRSVGSSILPPGTNKIKHLSVNSIASRFLLVYPLSIRRGWMYRLTHNDAGSGAFGNCVRELCAGSHAGILSPRGARASPDLMKLEVDCLAAGRFVSGKALNLT
jgi:hypothetical protein